MNGIVSYGVHLPYWRLDRTVITSTLGSGGGRGRRTVASYDEDTTSMGVEAGRRAMAATAPGWGGPGILAFATTSPGYVDKTNATAIHAALRLDDCVPAFDVGTPLDRASPPRSWSRMVAWLCCPTFVRADPARLMKPTAATPPSRSSWGDDAVIAEPLGYATVTAEFVDRWRVPGESHSLQWEERFGEHAYVPLATQAIGDVLKQAELSIDQVDHVVLTGLHARAVRGAAKHIGASPDVSPTHLSTSVGNAGTAHWGADCWRTCSTPRQPGDVVLIAHLADGCDAFLIRVADEIDNFRSRQTATVADQIDATNTTLDYPSFMTWRGFLDREPPRRPETRSTSGAALDARQLVEVRLRRCPGRQRIHPSTAGRVSVGSGSIDQMTPVPMADTQATIATFTVDRLAFSLAHPSWPPSSTSTLHRERRVVGCRSN